MAGVTDIAFRELCLSHGAAFAVSEMISIKGLAYGSKKTAELMQLRFSNCSDNNEPTNCAIQLFGNDPKSFAQAAKFATRFNPVAIDINMGCPTPKIVNNGAGSALMKTPKLCGEIVSAVKNAVEIPVTVKIRKGWDENSVNAEEIAKLVEENGADAITVHGRTREQFYSEFCDLEIIKKVKNAVKIPVVGNGDITNAVSAKKMLEYTNCDYIMIGRGALGNPWIFSEINEFLETGVVSTAPTFEEKLETLQLHIKTLCKYKGEKIGMKEARKHVGWYLKGFKNAAALRNEAGKLNTFTDLLELIKKIQYNVF